MNIFENAKATEAKATEATTTEATTTTSELKDKKGLEFRTALRELAEYVKANEAKTDAKIVELLKKLRPATFGLAQGGGFVKAETLAHHNKLFKVLGVKTFEEIKPGMTFDEMKAFKELKAGRKEMHDLTVDLIKKTAEKFPASVWVSFDETSGVYKVEGIGEKPADWNGYEPKAKAE